MLFRSGFVTGGRDISTLDNKAYWLDKDGLADVETEFFRQGHWDREGVKGYLALPCFNRANDMVRNGHAITSHFI